MLSSYITQVQYSIYITYPPVIVELPSLGIGLYGGESIKGVPISEFHCALTHQCLVGMLTDPLIRNSSDVFFIGSLIKVPEVVL